MLRTSNASYTHKYCGLTSNIAREVMDRVQGPPFHNTLFCPFCRAWFPLKDKDGWNFFFADGEPVCERREKSWREQAIDLIIQHEQEIRPRSFWRRLLHRIQKIFGVIP